MGSARFARSAAAALGGLMIFSDFFVFANAKNKKVAKMLLNVDQVDRQADSQTSILGSRVVHLTYTRAVTRI